MNRLKGGAYLLLLLLVLQAPLLHPLNCSADPFISLVYHNVGKSLGGDKFAVRTQDIVEQFEYLKTHGYHPVSMDEIIESNKRGISLPDKAVLITVDDGLESFYTTIFPLLKIYRYPAVLSIVASWIENGRAGSSNVKAGVGYSDFKVMTWEQVKEVSDSELVEVASHSYDLHKGIRFNPQGNQFAAGSSFEYFPETKSRELDSGFKKRIHNDLSQAVKIMKERLGVAPRVMVWPYGQFNGIGVSVADSLGMKINFSVMDGINDTGSIKTIRRGIVTGESNSASFVVNLRRGFVPKDPVRAVQVDLDLIYDQDPEQQERNLGKLLDRLMETGVNTVFLQAFSDIDGDGNASSLYFPNSLLPVKGDLFNRAAHQIKTRTGVEEVYAWLPLLAFALPDKDRAERLLVREAKDGETGVSGEGYRRLSPFSPESLKVSGAIYRELASSSNISGVLFQDDAYLTDFEDFHPDALLAFKEKFGVELTGKNLESIPGLVQKWTKFKTETLISFSRRMMESVRFYRPGAKFLRNIYADLLTKPESEEWFAQSYGDFLENYDYVVVMAYPGMEKKSAPIKWLKSLVRVSEKHPEGLKKTIFKIQSFDWRSNRWIEPEALRDQVYALINSGARHTAYYPDNLYIDKPSKESVKAVFSMKYSPFYP